jgi:hypothetical protein
MRPLGEFSTEHRYLTNTNVLETLFRTPTGARVLRDLISVSSEVDKRTHLTPEHEVLRELEGLEGEVEVEILYDPRPDYGRSARCSKCAERFARGENLRRRGHRRAGPLGRTRLSNVSTKVLKAAPEPVLMYPPARGDLTGVAHKPTLAIPLKRNVRRESRCRRHSMHASGGEVGVLFRRVGGGPIRPRSSRGRQRA